jgi:hypothetical protein
LVIIATMTGESSIIAMSLSWKLQNLRIYQVTFGNAIIDPVVTIVDLWKGQGISKTLMSKL